MLLEKKIKKTRLKLKIKLNKNKIEIIIKLIKKCSFY